MADESKLGIATIPIRGDLTGLDKDLESARAKTKGVTDSIAGTVGKIALGGLAVGAAAAAAAVVGIGVAAFTAAETMDEAYDTIQTKTGATGQDLANLQRSFKGIFSQFPTDAQTAAETLSVLSTRLKATGEDLDLMTGGLLDATRLLGTDAPKSTELFTRVLGDWGVKNEDGAKTLDMLFTGVQQTGIGFDDLMSKVVQFGSPMRLMGFTLKDAIALFGKWEKEGVNSELVMGSLRIAAGKFAKQGLPLRASLLATFKSIHDNTDASAALAEGMSIFGARAGPDMVAAIREGRFAFEDLLKVLDQSQGSIAATAQATEDWPEKWKRISNSITVAIAPIGDVLRGIAGTVLDYASPMILAGLKKVQDFAEEWGPRVSAGIKSVFDAFQTGGLLGGLANLGTDLGTVWTDTVGPALLTWSDKFWDWLTGPGGVAEQAFDRLQVLVLTLQMWATDPETIKGLLRIGEDIGTFITAAITGIFWGKQPGDTAMVGFSGSLLVATEALSEAFITIGMNVGAGIIHGMLIMMTMPKTRELISREMTSLFDDIWSKVSGVFGTLGNLRLPGYASGGVVPGPVGMPQLAVVHGGETILPAGTTNNWNPTFNYRSNISDPVQDWQMMRSMAGAWS